MSNQTRILCVDDERNVLRALERIFLDDDYEILTASSGEEGLELLNAAPQVQVVISDYRMPGMNGVEFLKEVFKSRPETIRIVLSGYADTAAVVAAINEGKIYKFIPKPWNDDELRVTVAKALETFGIHRRNLQLAEELRLKNEELNGLNANLERLVGERTSELMLQNRALMHARSVLNHLPVGVLGLSTDGVVVQINREAALLLGVGADEVLGKSMRDALPYEIRTLAGVNSDSTCDCLAAVVNGTKLQIKGITVAEEGQAGIILTIMRAMA
jgi:response regulator RpfG family c-di-GMP phosphodiesterase